MKPSTTSGIARRHDLDALRALAMLLGLAYHAALSFTPDPWLVKDLYKSDLFGLFSAMVHGFRMPLFILVSGYFTMMMYRRRGLNALLKQRFLRVFVPCMLGLVTVVPAMGWVFDWSTKLVAQQDATRGPSSGPRSELVEAVRKGDQAEVDRLLTAGADPNQFDPEIGNVPLEWAALYGNVPVTRLLLDRGADVKKAGRGGYTPLHSAAFLGKPEVVELLLERGADVQARGPDGSIPFDSSNAPWATTQGIVGFLKVPLTVSEQELQAAREQCRQILIQRGGGKEGAAVVAAGPLASLRNSYREFLTSDRFQMSEKYRVFGGDTQQPFYWTLSDVFGHLWFLWFLCWLVVLFAIVAVLARWVSLPAVPPRLILTPAVWLWLVPLTMIPQLFMGLFGPSFGPDTSTSWLPQPHLLVYYAIFFAFGVLYYDADDTEARLGRRYWLLIPVSLVVLLPLALATMLMGQTVLSGLVQVCYAWAMSFGMIGLFNRFLKHENGTLRYLSDSSYFLYLAHLPLVIALQAWVRVWELSPFLKFLFICVVNTVYLLFIYQSLVRYTWLGRLLNGPRTHRPAATPAD